MNVRHTIEPLSVILSIAGLNSYLFILGERVLLHRQSLSNVRHALLAIGNDFSHIFLSILAQLSLPSPQSRLITRQPSRNPIAYMQVVSHSLESDGVIMPLPSLLRRHPQADCSCLKRV